MSTAGERWWTKVLAGPGGDLEAADSSEEYVVLPKLSDPRVVVDRNDPDALKDAVDRMVSNRTTSGPVRSLAGGVSSLLSRRRAAFLVAAAPGQQTLREHLSDVLDTDLRISVAVGPPRPNRKPVIRCYRSDGLFAVAKLGPDPHTADMVTNEARWLDAMAAQPLSGVLTPPLLHAGTFGGSTLLVMGALDLQDDLGVAFDDVPLEQAIAFANMHAEITPMSESNWWHGLPGRMNDAKLNSVQAQHGQTMAFSNFDVVKTSAWHGDWSPWNMGHARNGKLCIWDWERARTGVPIGFDALHLHYQYGDGLDAAEADLERMGVAPQLHKLVKRMYLFELCARHHEAGALDTERHKRVIATLDTLAP